MASFKKYFRLIFSLIPVSSFYFVVFVLHLPYGLESWHIFSWVFGPPYAPWFLTFGPLPLIYTVLVPTLVIWWLSELIVPSKKHPRLHNKRLWVCGGLLLFLLAVWSGFFSNVFGLARVEFYQAALKKTVFQEDSVNECDWQDGQIVGQTDVAGPSYERIVPNSQVSQFLDDAMKQKKCVWKAINTYKAGLNPWPY